MTWQW